MGRPGCEVGVPRVAPYLSQRSPDSHFKNIDWFVASSSSDYIIIRPVQSALVILYPKICNFHFNVFVISQNWNDTDLTFFTKYKIKLGFSYSNVTAIVVCDENICETSNQDVGSTMWKWEKSNHRKVLLSQVQICQSVPLVPHLPYLCDFSSHFVWTKITPAIFYRSIAGNIPKTLI